VVDSGWLTHHSEKGRLWCSRSNWLAARTADHAIPLDGFHRIVQLARVGLPADQRPAANGLARAGHPVFYWVYLRLSFSRPSSGFFAVAAIPAARSFAIRPMSFTGTGLVRGNLTVPFRSS